MTRSGAGRHVARVSLVALGICSGFAGCTGSLFQSKAVPPSVYLLSAKLTTASPAPAGPLGVAQPTEAPGAEVPPAGSLRAEAPPVVPADLAVLRPRIRAGLESDRIAVLFPDRHLEYLADARWSGPLEAVVQDLALQAFDTGAHLRNVSADSSAFASGYWVEIEVADFQAEYPSAGAAPTIHVHLLVRVGAAGDRHVLASFGASARETASDNRVTAIVAAYERAADAALAQIVAATSRTLIDNLEHR
ncbi:MAG TPA: ABC-type transport auxiliary lipoprotein family protein [Steroidobacteraceae bacterium]|nr:ABC-type transport auxiliary lipoprotein family protein [Steroidobacteraceae bacterium]